MSHTDSRYRISREEMERRLRDELRGRCLILEESCEQLSINLNGQRYAIRNMGSMNPSQLEAYLSKLRKDESDLKSRIEIRDWQEKCDRLSSRIIELVQYLGIKDTFTADTGSKDLAKLKRLYNRFEVVIVELEEKKHQKLRLTIEKGISESIASFKTEDTMHISSETVPPQAAIERNRFDLNRYKELVANKLDGIEDLDFVAEHISGLRQLHNDAQYRVWLLEVTRKIEQERLLRIYAEVQSEMFEKLALLPKGPTKNTLAVEIRKLTEFEHWGEEYNEWERRLRQRKKVISEYIDKELNDALESKYVIACLEEALWSLGIRTKGHIGFNDGVASIIGRLDVSEKYGIAITVSQDTEEMQYRAVLLEGRTGSAKELSDFEKIMCPKVYMVVDELEKNYGVQTEFTIETPPARATDVGISETTQQDIKQEALKKQRQYAQNKQKRTQRMQRALS